MTVKETPDNIRTMEESLTKAILEENKHLIEEARKSGKIPPEKETAKKPL
jgi:hypothetical protein